jgi:hypothetical protein
LNQLKKLINNLTHLYVGTQLDLTWMACIYTRYSPYLLKKGTAVALPHAVGQKKRPQCMWDSPRNCTLIMRNASLAHLQHLCLGNIHDVRYSSVAHLVCFKVDGPADQKLRTIRYRIVIKDQRCLCQCPN